jgi:4-amino-4-deoxy-L-arabinose transferase-like glycosyltransferase
MIFLLVKRVSGPKTGFVASCLWMTSLFFVAFTHAATFDMLLTACVTAALFFFFRFESENKSSNLYFLYIFSGLGILAKGLVAPILIALPIGAYLLISHRLKLIADMKPVVGILIVIGTAAIWFLPVTLLHGIRFWDEFIYQHHFVRYTSSRFHTSGGFFFYVPILLLGTYPWTLAPFVGSKNESDPESQLKRFCFCWLVTVILFFSFAGSKLPGYILPAAPAFFVWAGMSVANFLEGPSGKTRWILLILAWNAAIIAAAWMEFPQYFQDHPSVRLFAIVIVACTMLSVFFTILGRRVAALILYALPVFVSLFLFVHVFLPESGWNQSKELARQANELLANKKKLLLYNIYAFDMVFYTNGRVELTPLGYFLKVENAQQLYDYVREKKTAYVLVGNEELSWIDRFSLWHVGNVIRGKERSIVELQLRP